VFIDIAPTATTYIGYPLAATDTVDLSPKIAGGSYSAYLSGLGITDALPGTSADGTYSYWNWTKDPLVTNDKTASFLVPPISMFRFVQPENTNSLGIEFAIDDSNGRDLTVSVYELRNVGLATERDGWVETYNSSNRSVLGMAEGTVMFTNPKHQASRYEVTFGGEVSTNLIGQVQDLTATTITLSTPWLTRFDFIQNWINNSFSATYELGGTVSNSIVLSRNDTAETNNYGSYWPLGDKDPATPYIVYLDGTATSSSATEHSDGTYSFWNRSITLITPTLPVFTLEQISNNQFQTVLDVDTATKLSGFTTDDHVVKDDADITISGPVTDDDEVLRNYPTAGNITTPTLTKLPGVFYDATLTDGTASYNQLPQKAEQDTGLVVTPPVDGTYSFGSQRKSMQIPYLANIHFVQSTDPDTLNELSISYTLGKSNVQDLTLNLDWVAATPGSQSQSGFDQVSAEWIPDGSSANPKVFAVPGGSYTTWVTGEASSAAVAPDQLAGTYTFVNTDTNKRIMEFPDVSLTLVQPLQDNSYSLIWNTLDASEQEWTITANDLAAEITSPAASGSAILGDKQPDTSYSVIFTGSMTKEAAAGDPLYQTAIYNDYTQTIRFVTASDLKFDFNQSVLNNDLTLSYFQGNAEDVNLMVGWDITDVNGGGQAHRQYSGSLSWEQPLVKELGSSYWGTADGTSTHRGSASQGSKGSQDYTITVDGTYSFNKFRNMTLPGPVDASITQDPLTCQLDYT
jgi:hypothetical protein